MPPDHLTIQPGTIHVWVAPLEAAPDAVDVAARTLSRDEHERAARYRGATLQRRFVVSRAALRRVLARYRGEQAAAIAFEYGPHGKPRVARDDPPFSVSHSGDVAVVAVSGVGPIGVDIEALRFVPDLDDLAARNFAPAESAAIAALPVHERAEAFFRVWTAKEAYVKAVGKGLSIPLHAFSVAGANAAPVVVHDAALDGAGAWWTRPFDPWRGFVGAVATAVPDATLVIMEPDS